MTIHPLADVKSERIGKDTTIWQFAVVLSGAIIGENCNINCHTFIENDVVIGNDVTIKAGVYLWDGIVIEDYVFVGPNASFTNDKYPRSKQYPSEFQKTILEEGCSIGANATVLGGVKVGRYAIVAAGSLVTKNIPPYALALGSPARIVAWLDEKGEKLTSLPDGRLQSKAGDFFKIIDDNLVKI